jgi:drug/metabolite transporter (DMT)-like permease
MLLASLTFAFMGAFVKILATSMSSVEAVFFRNSIGVIIILLSIWKKPLQQIGGKFWLLFARGFVGFVSLLFYFYAMSHIPLATAVTLNKTSPIFVAIFAWFFLKEHLGIKGWISIFIGFIGMMFIIKPIGMSIDKYSILGLISGIGAGLAYTSIRELRKFYETRSIVLSFMAVGTIGPIVLMIISEFIQVKSLDFMLAKFVLPDFNGWILAIGVGVFATISQLLMTKAYSLTKAGIVGSISYANIAFASIIGYFLGDELSDILTIIGIALIVASGILISKDKKK